MAFDNFSIKLKHPIESLPVDALSLASQMDADTEKKLMALADKLKYSVCLPSSARIRILATRVRNTEDALKISGIPMGIFYPRIGDNQ